MSTCLFSGLPRARQLRDMLVCFYRTFRVWSWEMHIRGILTPDVTVSFVRQRRRFRMSFWSARLMQLSVYFQWKWHDPPFCAFLSIFDESTSHCNEWRPFKIHCRYINPKSKRCAVSFCIQVTNSQGHVTPDCRIWKFTRGPICVLMRPPPFMEKRRDTRKCYVWNKRKRHDEGILCWTVGILYLQKSYSERNRLERSLLWWYTHRSRTQQKTITKRTWLRSWWDSAEIFFRLFDWFPWMR